MINPSRITNYDLDRYGLEENMLFWLLVAGKTAHVVARQLENILLDICDVPRKPFQGFEKYSGELAPFLKRYGVGCHGLKARGIRYLVYSQIDLKRCSVDDLEAVPGVGPKTARCFLMHTRRECDHAGLDTHILKFMRDHLGIMDAPVGTPGSKKQYLKYEDMFINWAKTQKGKTVAQLDLEIWNSYSRKVK